MKIILRQIQILLPLRVKFKIQQKQVKSAQFVKNLFRNVPVKRKNQDGMKGHQGTGIDGHSEDRSSLMVDVGPQRTYAIR